MNTTTQLTSLEGLDLEMSVKVIQNERKQKLHDICKGWNISRQTMKKGLIVDDEHRIIYVFAVPF